MCPDIEKIACLLLDGETIVNEDQKRFQAHLHSHPECRREFDEWQNATAGFRRTLSFRIRAHLSTEDFDRYFERSLSGSDRLRVQKHIATCETCRQDLNLLQDLAEMESTFNLQIAVSKFDTIRRHLEIFRIKIKNLLTGSLLTISGQWGYAVVMLLMVVLLGLSVKMDMQETCTKALTDNFSKQTAVADTISNISEQPMVDKRQRYAANFVTLPYLEEMIGVNLRAEQLKIISPPVDTLRSQEIFFQWQGGDANLLIKIIDNHDQIIFQVRPLAHAYTYRSSLLPGLYYWKLENAEDVLYVGKFYIGINNKDLNPF